MKSAAFLGVQMVVNALAAYAFQKVFAYHYGASVQKSIFDIAFSVPTMLVYLSGLGLTHAIVVALFTRLRNNDPASLDRVFSSLTNASLLALTALVLITAAASAPISELLAPGLQPHDRAAMQTLILWMLPLTLTFGLSSHLSAVAFAWRAPIGQEILLLIARLGVIVFVLANGRAVPLIELAAILVGSTIVAVSVQWAVLKRLTGLQYGLFLDFRDPAVRHAIHQLGGFLVVAVAAQMANAYGKRMGTVAGPSIVALLGFAGSLIDPLGAILGKLLGFQYGQSLAARLVSEGSPRAFSSFQRVVLAVLVASGLVAALTAVLAVPLVRLFFGGGQFDAAAVDQTAHYVQIMALGLPGAVTLWVVLYPLLGTGRHTAAVAYVLGHAAQIIAIRVLFSHVQGAAVAWGYSICLWVQAAGGWTLLTLRKRSLAGGSR